MATIVSMRQFVTQFLNMPRGINDSYEIINGRKINVIVSLPCCYVKGCLKAFRKLIFFFIFTFIELVNFKQNPINFRTKAKTLVICPQTLYIFVFEKYLLTIMMLTFIEINMAV